MVLESSRTPMTQPFVFASEHSILMFEPSYPRVFRR